LLEETHAHPTSDANGQTPTERGSVGVLMFAGIIPSNPGVGQPSKPPVPKRALALT
jgi:hypothetical protein